MKKIIGLGFITFALIGIIGCRKNEGQGSAEKNVVVFDFNAAVPDRPITPIPIQAKIHSSIDFRFIAATNGVSLFRSRDFVNGSPTNEVVPNGVIGCYLTSTAGGPFALSGPYPIDGTQAFVRTFGNSTLAVAYLRFGLNADGIKGIQCLKREDGHVEGLSISFAEIRDAHQNEKTILYFEDIPPVIAEQKILP